MATQRRSSRLQARRTSRQVSGLQRFHDESATSLVATSGPDRGALLNQQSDSYSSRIRDTTMELTKNSKYCALKLPALPTILKSSQDVPFNGCVDSGTESALLLTPSSAYIWRYVSPDHMPTTISFPIANATGALPLGVLVSPAAGSTEAGLVLVHPQTGNLMYWEAVGGAVAEGLLHRKKGVEATIGLYQGEVLEYLQNIEPVGVIVATSSGRFVLVSLHDSAGRPGVSCTVMRGSGTGLWKNLKGALKMSGTRRDVISIKPGKVLGRGERMAVTANMRGGVTIWHCSRSGDYSLLFEMDIRDHLVRSIIEVYPQADSTFQVHDVEMLPNDANTGLVLASFVYDGSGDNDIVFYILFTVIFDSADLRVVAAHRITCYLSKSSRPPRLYLPRPGYTAFIVLSNAVVMVDTVLQQQNGTAFRWEDVIEFKDTIDILTAGTEDILEINSQITRHAGIIVIARGAGVIRIERYEDETSPVVTHSGADVIKSKLEQAVYYGHIDENPLSFGQHREVRYDIQDIESAIATVSDEIVTSTSIYSVYIDDVVESLVLRCQLLGHLAEHLSMIFPSLSVECRYQIMWKLEKCEAAQNIWKAWFSSPGERSKMIVEVITEITQKSDYVEQFFRQDVEQIGDLAAAFSKKSIIRARTASGHRHMMVMHVREANDMLLSVLTGSAYFIREHYEEQVFKLTGSQWGSTAPWTSTWEILTALGNQFDVTRAVCTELWELSDKGETDVDYGLRELCEQLDGLAECLCRAYDERISYCSSTESLFEQAENLKALYSVQRGTWLKSLLFFGHGEKAFQLGEKYQDFRTLAEMCREEKAQYDRFNDESSRESQELLAARIKYYFDTYGYEFASVLYQYYIDSGNTMEIFVSFPSYHKYLEQFLSSGEYDRVAWIHDIQIGDFAAAGKKLRGVSQNKEDTLQNKQLQLSIAKLCLLSANVAGAKNDQDIFDVNNELEEIERQVLDATEDERLMSIS